MKKKRTKWIVIATITVAVIIAAIVFLNKRGATDIFVDESIQRVDVSSTAFENMGAIPDRYTGNGDDISPDFQLSAL